MLAISRGQNPGCEHLVADMRDARLGRTFDAVLVREDPDPVPYTGEVLLCRRP